jgi:hypothetical protein
MKCLFLSPVRGLKPPLLFIFTPFRCIRDAMGLHGMQRFFFGEIRGKSCSADQPCPAISYATSTDRPKMADHSLFTPRYRCRYVSDRMRKNLPQTGNRNPKTRVNRENNPINGKNRAFNPIFPSNPKKVIRFRPETPCWLSYWPKYLRRRHGHAIPPAIRRCARRA